MYINFECDYCVYSVISTDITLLANIIVEAWYNEDRRTWKNHENYLLFQDLEKKERKSWDKQNYLVIRGFCYIWALYKEIPLYKLYSYVQWNLVITRSLGPWKLPCYIRFLIISGGKKQRNIKNWDQQNYLVIRGFCYIRPLYNEVPL